MKYAILKCSNGSFSIVSEWTDKNKAIMGFHDVCKTLWNAEDVNSACVAVINERFETQKIEYIDHSEQ